MTEVHQEVSLILGRINVDQGVEWIVVEYSWGRHGGKGTVNDVCSGYPLCKNVAVLPPEVTRASDHLAT